MVYLHLPANFSEEEIMLQNKYEKLKRKKKALQCLKAPRQEPERITPVKRPQVEGRDAREYAKKLIRSGAIPAIKKAPKREEMSGFKRPRGLERRLERNTVSGYQPFSGNNDQEPIKPKPKPLYDIMPKNIPEEPPVKHPPPEKTVGKTVFVQGSNINELILRKTFADLGNIVNITMEMEKGRGFVTFEDLQSAAEAISNFNGTVVGSTELSVAYARRQPNYNTNNDSTKGSKMWSGEGKTQRTGDKRGYQDREIVQYDNIFD